MSDQVRLLSTVAKSGLVAGDFDLLLLHANAKLLSGQVTEAIASYAWLIVFRPDNYPYYQGLANAYAASGRFDYVRGLGEKMKLMDRDNPIGYYFCGLARLSLGHYREARQDVEIALRHEWSHEMRSVREACLKLGKMLEALDVPPIAKPS